MRRYWIPKECLQNDEVILEGDILHHIRDVCRMQKGSKFEVLTGGKAYFVEIQAETKKQSIAQILEVREITPRPKPDIILVMSVPRIPVFEAVLEKAVELGVSSIQLVFSDFSYIRTQDEIFVKKMPRWEKIVISATQQSGRGDLMPIASPINLESMLESINRKSGSVGLFAYEGDGMLSAKEGLGRLGGTGMDSGTPQEIYVFVGAEGGFSGREVELFRSFNLQPVTLGQQVLRVETACVTLVSILKYHFDQLS